MEADSPRSGDGGENDTMTWLTRIVDRVRWAGQHTKPAHALLVAALCIVTLIIAISEQEPGPPVIQADVIAPSDVPEPIIYREPHLEEPEHIAVPSLENEKESVLEQPAIDAGQLYRSPSPEIEKRLPIAIVIDDLGNNSKRLDRVLEIEKPLTLAFLSYANRLEDMTTRARNAGYELLVHMPMEPLNFHFPEGSRTLQVSMSENDLRAAVYWHLSRFDGFVGFNNHMGSKFTAHPAGMQIVLEIARDEGLMFLDSRTTSATVGRQISEELGVPVIERHVFLDNVAEVEAVLAQLKKAESVARRDGHAVAIGHPHEATLQALALWSETLTEFQIVPLSALVNDTAQPAEVAQN